MQKKVNVAVVGAGYWGPNLIRNFNSLPDCNVKVVCDRDAGRLNHIQQQYPTAGTSDDFQDVVNDSSIDAIIIATPVQSHFHLAQQALASGKHTFIEKPMAASVQECLKLNQLAKKHHLILMVGHTYIYSSPVRAIKKIIDSGELGEILYISSSRLNLGLFQKDINVTWDLAPHDLSIVQYLMNDTPVSLNCQGKAHLRPGVEDVTTLSLNFRNNAYAVFNYSWLDPNKVREMKIVGSKKMLFYDDNQPLEKIKIYDKRVEMPPYYDSFAEFQFAYHYGDVYSPYLKQIEPLKVETSHFIESIRSGTEPLTSGIEGLKVVQILEASTLSLKHNGANVRIGSSKVKTRVEQKINAIQNNFSFEDVDPRPAQEEIQFAESGLIIQ